MEARAITKFIRVSPRKVRLVVDQIRGKGVEEALNILKFTPKRSASIVAKTVRTAVANAENTQSAHVETLYVARPGPGHARTQAAEPRDDRPRRSAGEELEPDGSKNTSEDVSPGRDRDVGFEVVRPS